MRQKERLELAKNRGYEVVLVVFNILVDVIIILDESLFVFIYLS